MSTATVSASGSRSASRAAIEPGPRPRSSRSGRGRPVVRCSTTSAMTVNRSSRATARSIGTSAVSMLTPMASRRLLRQSNGPLTQVATGS